MWMLFGMVTVATVFALGFVMGRVWEIRVQFRAEQAKVRMPELTERTIGRRLRYSIAQTLASLSAVEHQSQRLRSTSPMAGQ
jgi:hypothetical protein